MTKKFFLVFILIVLASIMVLSLNACSGVTIEGISIDPASEYKTEYAVGDKFDITGMKILVKRSDGIESALMLSDIKDEIRILNFDTSKETEVLEVVVEYKNAQTKFNIKVAADANSSTLFTVRFEVGLEGATPVESQRIGMFKTVRNPGTPVKPDGVQKAFDGWYKEIAKINKWNFSVDTIQEDTTIYAKWVDLVPVTFEVVGGPSDGEIIVKYVKIGDELADAPSVPDWEGHVGVWDRQVFTRIYSGNIRVKSIYTIKEYTVTFCYYDSEAKLQTIETVEKIPHGTNMYEEFADVLGTISPPTEIGLTKFTESWSSELNNITNDMTVIAVYASKECEVSFNLAPSTDIIQPITIIAGNVISVNHRPNAPVLEGYRFDGWYKDAGLTIKWDFDLNVVESNLTLFAKWTKTFPVHYLIDIVHAEKFPDLEERITRDGSEYIVYGKFFVPIGGSIENPTPPDMTGYGATWSLTGDALKNITTPLYVTAHFTKQKYTVTFVAEDGTVIDQQLVEYGESAIDPEQLEQPKLIPLKYGYTFDETLGRWANDFECITQNTVVRPRYIPKDVEVRVYPDNGYVSPEGDNFYKTTAKFDSTIEIAEPIPVKTGYEFDNWYTDNSYDISKKWILSESVIKQEDTISIYAKWLNIYKVKFEEEESEQAIAEYPVVEGKKLGNMPAVPEKVGYTGAWYIYESGSYSETSVSMAYWNINPINKNYVIKPKYTIKVYDIIFNIDSQVENIVLSVAHGKKIVRPPVVNPGQEVATPDNTAEQNLDGVGKIFLGWEPENQLNQEVTENKTFVVKFKYKTFKVKWYDKDNSTIIYELEHVEYGKNAEVLFNNSGVSIPYKEGHTFTGWDVYRVNPHPHPNPPPPSASEVKEDILLKPHFEKNTYEIAITNLYSGDEKLPNINKSDEFNKYVSFGIESVEIIDPIRTGHKFDGWRTTRFNIDRTTVGNQKYWVLTNEAYTGTGIHYFDNNSGNLIIFKDQIYRGGNENNGLGQDGWMLYNTRVRMDAEHGWIDSAISGDVKSIAFPGNLFYVYGEASDFEARYTINNYTVTFNVNTTDPVTNKPNAYTAKHNSIPVIPKPQPERANFVFLGWYEEAELTNRWDVKNTDPNSTVGGGAYRPLTSSYTVFARWESVTAGATSGIEYILNQDGTGYIVSSMVNVSSEITSIVIPNYYDGKPVVGIGNAAVYSNPVLASKVVSISLPNTLYQIAPDAFKQCTKLETIAIPASVRTISSNAFEGCTSLVSVTFKEGTQLESIESFAFIDNTSLTSIVLPNTLTRIGEKAFYGCSSLLSVNIPASVRDVEDFAFGNCKKLIYAYFNGENPINLGSNVFYRNDETYNGLKIYVKNPAKYGTTSANANWRAYYEEGKIIDIQNISIDHLWSFKLDGTAGVQLIQYLGDNAIVNIPSSLYIPGVGNAKNVTRILNYAFDARVRQVSFESTVSFEQDAFSQAVLLENITLKILETIPTSNFDLAYVYRKAGNTLKKLTVTSNKTLYELFGGEPPTNLKEVEIIEQYDYIAEGMFRNCRYIEEVRFDTSIREIKDNAFSGALSLKRVYIKSHSNLGNTLNIIGKSAFYGAQNLANFYKSEAGNPSNMVSGLPSTMTSIGQDSFTGTKWLANQPSGLVIIGDGIVYTYKQSTASSTVVMIPTTVKRVMDRAFYGNTHITHVIPEDIANSNWKFVGVRAFSNCDSLEAVVLPSVIERIENYAFENSTKLGTLVIFGTSSPFLGADFISNTLRRQQGGVSIPGIELYVDDGLEGVDRNKYEDLQYSKGISVNYVTGLAINYGENNKAKWVYSDGSVTGIKIIKSCEDGVECIVPESLSSMGVTEIANNAFSRKTTKLTLRLNVSVKSHSFAGVTKLEQLSINALNQAAVSIDGGILRSLMTANSQLSVLNTASVYSMKYILAGNILPMQIKTVNILAGQETIETQFLDGCVGVEHINILSEVADETIITPLENNLSTEAIGNLNIGITTIKDNAFNGTGWMNNLDEDFILVLDGMLVDYKGADSVLRLPSAVKTVGHSVFKNNQQIEIVYIPSSVTKIESLAFNGATNLVKIFLAHENPIPTVRNDSFTMDNGKEIFVKNSTVQGLVNAAPDWSSYVTATKVEPNVPLIEKEVSRAMRKDATGNVILDVRSQIYLIDSGSGIDKSKLHWYRDVTISYQIPNDTPSYQKDTFDYTGCPVVSVTETKNVVIPEEIKNGPTTYIITDLANNVLMSTVNAFTINLDDSVTQYSFSNLSEARTITVKKTNNLAERKITGKELTDIIRNEGITTINYLGNVKLDSLLEIVLTGEGPHNYRPDCLTAVGILDGAIEVAEELLQGWANISQISVPKSVERIGVNAFETTYWFANYDSARYGKDMLVVGDKILYKYKGNATSVVIPGDVEIINTGAFSTATKNEGTGDWDWSSSLGVTSIRFTVDSKATTILEYAFKGCTHLNEFNSPNSLRNVAQSAFEGTKFTVSADGLLILSGPQVQGRTVVKYLGDAGVTVINLPADIKIIASEAFRGLTSLANISWGAEASLLAHIGDLAFEGCTSLSTVPLSSSLAKTPHLQSVGKDAFKGTVFENTATHFMRLDGKKVIYKQSPTLSFEITPDIYSITDGALYDSGSPNIPAGIILQPSARIPQKDMYNLLSKSSVTTFTSNGATALKDLIGKDKVLPNIVTLSFDINTTAIVSEYAKNWYSVENINWHGNIKSIGRDAVTGTKWLNNVQNDYVTTGGNTLSGILIKYKGLSSNVYINRNITSISTDALRGNVDITRVEFDEASKIDIIPVAAFSGCSSLLEIVNIPKTVTSIGQDAFKDTAWLNAQTDLVIINGLLIAYNGDSTSIVIPQEVKTIYPYVFAGNKNITSLEINKYSLLTRIEAGSFAECTSLSNVKLSESIKYVDKEAFTGTIWLNNQVVGGGFIVYEDTYESIYRLLTYVGTNTQVTIPDKTTEICEYTFRGNRNLTSININKAIHIPNNAFYGCTALSNVSLSSGVTIGSYAFEGTPWFTNNMTEFVIVGNGNLIKYNGTNTSVVLNSGIKSIAANVFENNTSIVSIDLSQSQISTLPENVFKGASSLANITFNSKIKEIGANAFYGTPWLNNQLSAEGDVYVVVNGILVACKLTTTTVTIPSNVEYIPDYVFKNNTLITTLQFDNSNVILADFAFYGCTNLDSIVNSSFISHLGTNTFSNTKYYADLQDNSLLIINHMLVGYKGEIEDLIIPANVTRILAGAFKGSSVVSLSFEDRNDPIIIEKEAFLSSRQLANVALVEYIDEVGKKAFANTPWISSLSTLYVSINNKLLMYIGSSTTISIPNTITSMAKGIFTNNKAIVSVNFSNTSQNEFVIPENSFSGCTSLGTVSLPRNPYIGKNAFYGTPWIRTLGNYPKYNNKIFASQLADLTNVVLPSGITGIYPYVFQNNTQIVSLDLSQTSIETLVDGEFSGCTMLANVTLNNSLQDLSASSFALTPWLINYSLNHEDAKFIMLKGGKLLAYIATDIEVVLPSTTTYIAKHAFYNNTSITSVDFSSVINNIVIPSELFKNCTSLNTVILTGYVKAVGIDAFAGTPWYAALDNNDAYIVGGNLLFFKGMATSYTVPAEVTHIGMNAFYGSGVQTLTLLSQTPCTLGSADTLSGVTAIYVPDSTALSIYSTHDSWRRYANIMMVAPEP
jgi:uncharacterized repeat protein (TIGR02543 family)